MKFSVSSGDLLSRLQTMGKIIEEKSNDMPILANFLFAVKGQMLVITAANKEMRMVSSIDINNIEGSDSRICLPGLKITEYIKNLPEQPITFTIPEGSVTLEIQSLSGKSMQNCLSADDYPEEKNDDADVKTFKTTEQALLAGISSTLFATAVDTIRPVMNGIYFDIEPGKLTFVATDTKKLVRYIRTDVQTGELTAGFVLNKKPASVLKGILGKTESPVTVTFGDKTVVFESAVYRYSCRQTEGTYPNYKSVIPTGNDSRVVVNKNEFVKAVLRSSVFVDASRLVKCELFSNTIQISTQDLDFSCSANEVIPCEYDGPQMSIGFGCEHLIESLNALDSEEVVILLSDPSKAGLVSPATNAENSDMLIVIMPMHV